MKHFLTLFLTILSIQCTQIDTFTSFLKSTFDLDHNLIVTFPEWAHYFSRMEPDHEINSTHLLSIFSEFDLNSDNMVTIDEFLRQLPPIDLQAKIGPKQIHISFTSKDGEMQVMWITQPERAIYPMVQYGVRINNLSHVSKATFTQYNVGQFGFHGRIYRAVMKDLIPNHKYYYRVGDNQSKLFSEVLEFKSRPNQDYRIDRIHFAVFGDMGSYLPFGFRTNQQIIELNSRDPLDFVLLTGDIAYAGTGSKNETEPLWDVYGEMIEKWAKNVPFMAGVGNHQHYYNYTAYKNRYYLPKSELAPQNFWFSFDYASVHIVYISSDHSYQMGSPQYIFLQDDLKKASSNPNTKWIILATHRPFYASSDTVYDQNHGMAFALEDLINLYKVDLVQTGHMHCYERTWPLKKGIVYKSNQNITHFIKPQAPIYVVQGTAGALIHQHFLNPLPQWSIMHAQKYGMGRIEIVGNTLKYQFLSAIGNWVLDQWYISK